VAVRYCVWGPGSAGHIATYLHTLTVSGPNGWDLGSVLHVLSLGVAVVAARWLSAETTNSRPDPG
jgi:hypothetical protein